MLQNPHILGVLKPMIEDVKELASCGNQELERDARSILNRISGESVVLLASTSESNVDRYINENDMMVLCK